MANLAYGSSGQDVRELQKALIAAGYDVGSSGADGIIGEKTAAAIKAYQRDNGLSVDGVAGTQTQGSLRNGGFYNAQPVQQQTAVYQSASSPKNDLSQYLKDQAKAQLESELANLKNAYERNISAYDEQAKTLPSQYEEMRNAAAAQEAIARRNFNEQAAAVGLNTGTGGQASLSQSVAYQNALAQIDRDETEALRRIESAKDALTAEYENAMASAKATGDAALANKLYNEMVRLQGMDDGVAVQTAALPPSTGLTPAPAATPTSVAHPTSIGGKPAEEYYAAAGNYAGIKTMVNNAVAAGDKAKAKNILLEAYNTGALNLSDYSSLMNKVRG